MRLRVRGTRRGRGRARRRSSAPRVGGTRHGALAPRGAAPRLSSQARRKSAAHDLSQHGSPKGGEMKSNSVWTLLLGALGGALALSSFASSVDARATQSFTAHIQFAG